MDCPKCKLIVIGGSERCDCGYNFQTGAIDRVQPAGAEKHGPATGTTAGQVGRRWWWIGLVALGKVAMRACNNEDQRNR
jgi:hypothetical protein